MGLLYLLVGVMMRLCNIHQQNAHFLNKYFNFFIFYVFYMFRTRGFVHLQDIQVWHSVLPACLY